MPRRLGQHFLTRTSILERIAAAVPSGGVTVEIGPGRGALTHHLLPRSESVIAIELDQVLVHYLTEKFRQNGRLTVLHADILKTDLTQWGPVAVAGNLPYYITSPIVERVLRIGPLLRNAVFLVQKEVAARMAAVPGNRDYGYLTVACQVMAEAAILCTVPPEAFKPPPKVDSAVIQLSPRPGPLVPDLDAFLRFAGLCFAHKRKKLRNNLSGRYDLALVDAQPEANLRAEQLSVQQMADLMHRLSENPG